MDKTISIKDLRNNIAAIASKAEEGQSFTVIRRSKKSFRIVPCNLEEAEEWETIADFTEKGKKKGEKIEDILKALKKLNT